MEGVYSSSYCPLLTAQMKAPKKPKAIIRLTMIKMKIIPMMFVPLVSACKIEG